MTTAYFLNSGLKLGSDPCGAVVATSTVKRLVSSRYFFIILVVSGQFLWLLWPSMMRALRDWAWAAAGMMRSRAARRRRGMSGSDGGIERRREGVTEG